MTDPKAYIYGFGNIKAIVCAYSIDLFNLVLKSIKTDCEVYIQELGLISHKVYNRSTCNCKETIKEISTKLAGKLKSFEKVVIPLEFLELERGNSHLLICEMFKTHKKTDCKLKILNTATKIKRDTCNDNEFLDVKPKNCLLRLYSIFNHDISGYNDIAGRNNSLSSKAVNFKDCFKEVSRELAGKGALPSQISQKCLHSRDMNRCWFDYGRILDICIHHKFSAKDIAELIKHIAAVDPMQPDPVLCIKGRLGIKGGGSRSNKRGKDVHSDISARLSTSQSSSEKTTSSSSSSDFIACKSRSSSKANIRLQRSFNKKKHRSISSNQNVTKETQTSNCTQSQTQTEFHLCRCVCKGINRRVSQPQNNDGSFGKYLWAPNCYDGEEHMTPEVEEIEEPLMYDQDDRQYQAANESQRYNRCSRNESVEEPSNFREGDYDSQIFDDFLRQSDYYDNECELLPNCSENIEEPFEQDLNRNVDCSQGGLRRRMNSLNLRLQPSASHHPKASANNPNCMKYRNGSNNADQLRSVSQPVQSGKNYGYRLVSSSNNCREQEGSANNSKVKVMTLSKTGVNSETQTLVECPAKNVKERSISELKKFASEGNICHKTGDDRNDNNSSKESTRTLSHVGVNTCLSLNASKIFKMEAVQTDFGDHRSDDENLVSQPMFPPQLPPYMYRRRIDEANFPNSLQRGSEGSFQNDYNKKGAAFLEDVYESNGAIYDNIPVSLNRNANNHSMSRSPSSRNSQIVEVDNENMEKVSSVIVDQESRPIIYFTGRNQGSLDYISVYRVEQNPFYEKGDLYSDIECDRINTNFSNSIKSVTVASNEPVTGKSSKCSVAGCQNPAEGSNYVCEHHGTIRSSPCSPERCLSRLSCLINLNKQLLDSDKSIETSSPHGAALRRIIYGPYDDEDLVTSPNDLQSKGYQPIEIVGDYVPNKYQHPSTGNKISNSKKDASKRQSIPEENKSGNLPRRSSDGHLAECYPMVTVSSSKKNITDLTQINNPAPILYQSEQEEIATPMYVAPTPDGKSAAITRCKVDSNIETFLNASVSNTKVEPNNNLSFSVHEQVVVDSQLCTPIKEMATDHNLATTEAVKKTDGQYILPNMDTTVTDNYVGVKMPALSTTGVNHPCNRLFPLNFQLCPVSGCRNITTTGQPLCVESRLVSVNSEKPHSVSNVPFVGSPYVISEVINEPEVSKPEVSKPEVGKPSSIQPSYRKPVSQKVDNDPPNNKVSHAELQEPDVPLSNEVVFNDSLQADAKQISVYDTLLDHPNVNTSINDNVGSMINTDSRSLTNKQSMITSFKSVSVMFNSSSDKKEGSTPKNSYKKVSLTPSKMAPIAEDKHSDSIVEFRDPSKYGSGSHTLSNLTEKLHRDVTSNAEYINDIDPQKLARESAQANVSVKSQVVFVSPPDFQTLKNSIQEAETSVRETIKESVIGSRDFESFIKPSEDRESDNRNTVKVYVNGDPDSNLEPPQRSSNQIVIESAIENPRSKDNASKLSAPELNMLTEKNTDSLLKNSVLYTGETVDSSLYKREVEAPIKKSNDYIIHSVLNGSSILSKTSRSGTPCLGIKDPYFQSISIKIPTHGTNYSLRYQSHTLMEEDIASNNSSAMFLASREKYLDLDYLYLDCVTTKIKSRIFTNTLLFKDPHCLVLGECRNMFYSTSEHIHNRHSSGVIVSEMWNIYSDLVIENLDSMTVNIPALVDHPQTTIILLISLSVYFLFSKQLPILINSNLNPLKTKKSKLTRIFKSFRPLKLERRQSFDPHYDRSKNNAARKCEKTELIRDFKNKMVKIIKRCRTSKIVQHEENCHATTFKTEVEETSVETLSDRSSLDIEEYAVSVDHSEISICSRSCTDLRKTLNLEEKTLRRCNSEPGLEIHEEITLSSIETLRKSLLSHTKISTSDLNLLCIEVLRKIEGKTSRDQRKEKDLSSSCMCKSTTLTQFEPLRRSRQDTLKLIIDALNYIHRSHRGESGPSNKTLDSVSSIRTSSGDRLQSIVSLQRQTVLPKFDDNIFISAHNKTD